MGRVYYSLPKLRYSSVARFIFFADAVSCVALWLAGGNAHYMEDMIVHFKVLESVFELACLALLKLCVLFFVFVKLEDIAMEEIEDPYNPKLKRTKAALHVLTVLLTLLSLGYSTTKGVLVLVNKTYTDEAMHATYIACCVAAFTFSLVEFAICLLYPMFLRKLKVFRIKHQITDDGVEIQEDGDGQIIQNKANLARVIKLAKPEIGLLTIGMTALVISSASSMAMPLFFGFVINEATTSKPQGGSMAAVNKDIIIFCLIGFVGSIASLLRSWLFTLAGIRVVCRIRQDLFAAIIRQEVGFFDTNRTGELTNRLSSDTQVIQNAITVNISMLIRYVIQIVGSLAIMFKLSPSLTGVLLACVPIVAIGAVQYGRFIQKVQKNFQDELAAAGTTAEENISNIRTVRSFCGEGKANNLYGKDIGRSYDEGKKLAGAQGLFNGLLGIVSQGSIAMVLWYGAKLVFEGHISIGTLTSFMFYTMNVAMAFAFLSALYGDFMKSVGASQRMFELMDRVPEVQNEGGTVLAEFPCDMQLEHVSFTYPSRPETKVIKDVSFSMKAGSVVALVGPSGGGKSTVVSLIEKFYLPDGGSIKLGDHDMKDLDPTWFRTRMAMVGQEPVLFASSIKDNIMYGRDATDQEVEDAARRANAHEFISSFEEGYDTMVGERGVRLSGGQKQRIAIARALIMDPNILLLDEATSALDAESEHLVQEAIDRAMKGRTVLVIAHRLSTVRNASQVIVINKGVVAERGTHDELIRKGGVYKKLVLRQLSAGALTNADVHVNVASDDILLEDDDENRFEDSDS